MFHSVQYVSQCTTCYNMFHSVECVSGETRFAPSLFKFGPGLDPSWEKSVFPNFQKDPKFKLIGLPKMLKNILNSSAQSNVKIFSSGIPAILGDRGEAVKYCEIRCFTLYCHQCLCFHTYRVPQKKCPIANFSLNLFQRSDYTFSHVLRNQNFEPVPSKHFKHTHSEY